MLRPTPPSASPRPLRATRLAAAFLAALALAAPLSLAAYTPVPKGDRDYDEAERFVFGPEDLPLIEVTLDSADFASFLDDPWQEEYRRCSVRFVNSMTDEWMDDVGIRVRGNTSRDALKKSWKLSFNAFVRDRKFHGMEKMNLNGDRSDPTVTRSVAAFDLYRAAGVPAPRARHVRLKINDGSEVEGVFVLVEQVDEEFAEAWFGGKNGSLYKCLHNDGDPADLRYVAPGDGAAYAARGNGETYVEKNLDAPDYEDLADLIRFIHEADDETFAAGLGDRLDVDNFLRVTAVDLLIGNWDNYWYGGNNYYLYRNEATGRFAWIPHDMDNTFGTDFWSVDWSVRPVEGWGDGGFGSTMGSLPPLIDRALRVPAFRRRLEGYMRRFAAGPFSTEERGRVIDAARAAITPYVFEGSYRNGRMDWGYGKGDFLNAFDYPGSFIDGGGAWDYGLKSFVADRVRWTESNVRPSGYLPHLRVNEALAENRSGDRDEAGEREDWIELANDWVSIIDLGGMYLTDDPARPKKWRIPEGVRIDAGERIRFWCDGETEEGPMHAGFRLDPSGAAIALVHGEGERNTLIDVLEYRELGADVSFGRAPDLSEKTGYCRTPTAGAHNILEENIPPLIDRVRSEPTIPLDDEAFAIAARARDLDGAVDSVLLHAVLDGEPLRVPMTPEGGGTYRYAPAALPEGARVSWWLEARDDDGAVAVAPPGAPDSVFGCVVEYRPPLLLLNEVVPEETGGNEEDGGGGGWIEIRNAGNAPVVLGGFLLSAAPDTAERLALPEAALEPGGYLAIRCEGPPGGGGWSAPFRLSPAGGDVRLAAPLRDGGATIDSVRYGPVEPGGAWGRDEEGDGSWGALAAATPGAPNGGLEDSAASAGPSPLLLRPHPVRIAGGSTILFDLDRAAEVRIRLYDAAGRLTAEVLRERLAPGTRRIEWKPRDRSGREPAPGVYFLRVEAGGETWSGKAVLIR